MNKKEIRHFVTSRADNRCEFCHLHQQNAPFYRFHIEHIIPRQHGGKDRLDNLALACPHCNLHKGSNLSAIDPGTSQVVLLYNPRQQNWEEHFKQDTIKVIGLNKVGRATIKLLQMNAIARLELRRSILNI